MSMTFDQAAHLRTVWTNAPGAVAQLDAMVVDGVVNPYIRDDLTHFTAQRMVLEACRDRDCPDRQVVDDIRSVHRHPGRFVRTDHRNDGASLQVTGATPDHFRGIEPNSSAAPAHCEFVLQIAKRRNDEPNCWASRDV